MGSGCTLPYSCAENEKLILKSYFNIGAFGRDNTQGNNRRGKVGIWKTRSKRCLNSGVKEVI